jgi:outer membrane OprD family porin
MLRGAIAALLAALLAAACLMLSHQAFAQGVGGAGDNNSDNADDYPIPSTARQSYSPIREGFTTPIEPRADLKGPTPYVDERAGELKAARRNEVPFFRDAEIKLNNRSYWFAQDTFGLSKPEALTSGGSLSYRSGYLADFLKLGATVYTSQPLYAPADAGETLNLTIDGDQITTLGQANASVKLLGQEITAGRELVRTPYINPNDSRMIPLTFEGIVLLPAAGDDPHLDYIASYLWRYKPRDTSEFVPFTQPLGVTEDEGVLINGVHYRGTDFNVGFVNYWIKDAMNTVYGEVDYTLHLGAPLDGPELRLSLNDTDQRSVGAELIPGSPFATFQASARLIASYRGFVLTGALSQVGREAELLKPYGWSPSYTAMMISSFQRAGEFGALVRLSYDFSRLGLNGLAFYASLGRGTDAITPATGASLPNRDEIDLRFEYEPHGNSLEGLRVQLDYIDQRLIDNPTPSDDLKQFRAIVNYLVPLF